MTGDVEEWLSPVSCMELLNVEREESERDARPHQSPVSCLSASCHRAPPPLKIRDELLKPRMAFFSLCFPRLLRRPFLDFRGKSWACRETSGFDWD